MARYNEILVGRYNRYLQKLLSMKGPPPAPQLSSEIQPQVSFYSGRETRILESWYLYAIGLRRGPVVNNFKSYRLRNPAGSGMIGVVEMIAIQQINTTAAQVSYVPNTTLGDLTINEVANVQGLDNRSSSGTSSFKAPALILSSGDNAAQLVGFTIMIALGFTANVSANRDNLIVTPNNEIPILPGAFLQIDAGAINVNLVADIWWRERALEDSEVKA